MLGPNKDTIITTELFQDICSSIARSIKKETRNKTQMYTFDTMVIQIMLYGCEVWTLRKYYINRK